MQRVKSSLIATDTWGPSDPKTRSQWILFKQDPPAESSGNWLPKWIRRVFKRDSKAINNSTAGLRHHNPVVSQSSVSIIQIGRSQESITSQH